MMTARLRVRYSLRTWWLRIFRPKKFKRLTRFYSVLVDSDWIGGDDGAHRPQPQVVSAVAREGVMDKGQQISFNEAVAEWNKCKKQRDAAVAALEAVEWANAVDGGSICPWCYWRKPDGHAPDCQRQAALALCQGQQP